MGLSGGQKAWLNVIIGCTYFVFLCVLTGFWPSSSLIVLLSLHLGGMIWVAVSPEGHARENGKLGFLQIFSWHHVPVSYNASSKNYGHIHYFMAIAHLFVVFMNMLGFLEVTIKGMPASTIRFGGEMQLDHTRFGVDGFKQPALPTDSSRFSLVQMPQRGFYYAEEYRGEFGSIAGRKCLPDSGWRCFAVGVRTFNNSNPPSSSTPNSGDSWYQPLPTRGYNVDLQVAAAVDVAVAVNGSAVAVDPCTTLGEIYIQHVNGFGKPMGNFRPIMEFNGSQPRTIQLCPTNSSTIGCVQQQTQTAAAYTASLRAECTRIRKDEEYGAGYKVSYIPIPQSVSTVDMSTGAITHTIIIMPEAAKPAAVLRVRPSEDLTTAPLFSLFHPIGPLDHQATLPGSGNVNDWRSRGVQYASAAPTMIYNQPYDAASKLDGKSIPSNYRQIDYQQWTLIYIAVLFLFPLCIAWYYVVMGVPGFETSPRFATWFVVRLPILVAAGSLGAMAYCTAQACIIGAAFLHGHLPRTWYAGAMFCAFASNCIHMVLWGMHLTEHGHLSSFAPYASEYMPEYGIVSRGATTLFLPIMRWFLLIEPVVWCFFTLLRVAVTMPGMERLDFEGYKALLTKAGMQGTTSRYQLLATTARKKSRG